MKLRSATLAILAAAACANTAFGQDVCSPQDITAVDLDIKDILAGKPPHRMPCLAHCAQQQHICEQGGTPEAMCDELISTCLMNCGPCEACLQANDCIQNFNPVCAGKCASAGTDPCASLKYSPCFRSKTCSWNSKTKKCSVKPTKSPTDAPTRKPTAPEPKANAVCSPEIVPLFSAQVSAPALPCYSECHAATTDCIAKTAFTGDVSSCYAEVTTCLSKCGPCGDCLGECFAPLVAMDPSAMGETLVKMQQCLTSCVGDGCSSLKRTPCIRSPKCFYKNRKCLVKPTRKPTAFPTTKPTRAPTAFDCGNAKTSFSCRSLKYRKQCVFFNKKCVERTAFPTREPTTPKPTAEPTPFDCTNIKTRLACNKLVNRKRCEWKGRCVERVTQSPTERPTFEDSELGVCTAALSDVCGVLTRAQCNGGGKTHCKYVVGKGCVVRN